MKAAPKHTCVAVSSEVTHSHPQTHTRAATVRGYNTALCRHRDGGPAQASPIRLCGYLGINALIETSVGQFCKCWDIKKATFYYPERL